jgi:hypothetical protein
MKKNTFLYILLALVVFFFVFGMGRFVYEGFGCTSNSQCPQQTQGGVPHCGVCGKNGQCSISANLVRFGCT